jgi:excisionase family DNA binding protein
MSERLLKIEDVARDYLQIARTRVYELVGSGEIESIVIGRSRRVPESAVQAYIDRLSPIGDGECPGRSGGGHSRGLGSPHRA